MTIQYYTKEVYGKPLMYLADTTQALNWKRLSGRKTIDTSDMAQLRTLTGATFERVFEPSA